MRFCVDLGRFYLEQQNVEQGISNIEGKRNMDLEKRLIDFAVRIIRTAESLSRTKNFIIRNFLFVCLRCAGLGGGGIETLSYLSAPG
jgi:hypothetical protein